QGLPGRRIDLVVVERPGNLWPKLGLREKEWQTVRHLGAASFPHNFQESSIGFRRLVLQAEHNGMPQQTQRPVCLNLETIVAQAEKELIRIFKAMMLQVVETEFQGMFESQVNAHGILARITILLDRL